MMGRVEMLQTGHSAGKNGSWLRTIEAMLPSRPSYLWLVAWILGQKIKPLKKTLSWGKPLFTRGIFLSVRLHIFYKSGINSGFFVTFFPRKTHSYTHSMVSRRWVRFVGIFPPKLVRKIWIYVRCWAFVNTKRSQGAPASFQVMMMDCSRLLPNDDDFFFLLHSHHCHETSFFMANLRENFVSVVVIMERKKITARVLAWCWVIRTHSSSLSQVWSSHHCTSFWPVEF